MLCGLLLCCFDSLNDLSEGLRNKRFEVHAFDDGKTKDVFARTMLLARPTQPNATVW
jgi:hypothetical protein